MRFIVQGYPAYCSTGGRPFAPDAAQSTVILIHGAAMDGSAWQWQARALAHRGHRVLAPDLPAHGRSPGNPRTDVQALAAWIIALMDAAQIEQAVLIGHSLGALVALETGVSHAHRVRALGLLGCAVPMSVGPAFLAAAQANTSEGILMQTVWSHAPSARMGAAPTPGLSLVGASRAIIASADPGVQHAGLLACNQYARSLETLGGLACPTLVIAGQRDLMTPLKASSALAQAIPGARLTTLDAGHALMSERPREVTQALVTFLAGLA